MQEQLATILENKFITGFYKYVKVLSSAEELSSIDDMLFPSRGLNKKM
jgi:hypothetical protein